MRQAPWLIGGAVLLGAGFGTLTFVLSFPSLIFLGIAFAVLIVYVFPSINHFFLLLAFGIFLIIFVYAQSFLQSFSSLEAQAGSSENYRVLPAPEQKEFYQEIILQRENCFSRFCKSKQVLWQAPLTLEVRPGEKIALTCDLEIPKNFSKDFDYKKYLAKEGIGYICKEERDYGVLGTDFRTRVTEIFLIPKYSLEEAINKSIPEPEAGLAKGLLLGGSNYLSATTQKHFTNVGLTHIVAVSGYNIVIIVNALLILALFGGFWRRGATLFSFLGIILFILLIGSPASAVRAGSMALAAFGAFLIGRVSYSLIALFFTAALMTLWNPLVLWYDAGFQLSFLATLAVIISLRVVEGKFSPRGSIKAFQEIIWLSISVYLFLLPLLLLQFKTLTLLSIPANILFLPVVPLAMFSSFLVAVLTLVFPSAGILVGWIAYIPLTYIMKGVYFLSTLPHTIIPFSMPLGLVIFWYILLLIGIIAYERKRRKKQYEKNFTCPHQH